MNFQAFHSTLLDDVEFVSIVTLAKDEVFIFKLKCLKAVYEFQLLKFVEGIYIQNIIIIKVYTYQIAWCHSKILLTDFSFKY